jgi:hypothetical protein
MMKGRAGAPEATLFWSLVHSTCSYVQPLDQLVTTSTGTVGCASCACMRSLAFRRGMGDSAQCLLHAGAVTLSHDESPQAEP